MKYQKKEENNYNLHYIQTDKFRTTTIALSFINEYSNFDNNNLILLFKLLLRNTKNTASVKNMTESLLNLYIKKLTWSLSRRANAVFATILIEVYDEDFVGEDNTKGAIELLKEIIYQPKMKDNLFNEEDFLKVQAGAVEEAKLTEEYAFVQAEKGFLKHFAGDSPMANNMTGNSEKLANLSNEEISQTYFELLNSSNLEISFVSKSNLNKLENYLGESFKTFTKKDLKFNILKHPKGRVKTIEETGNNIQSISFIGYKINDFDYKNQALALVFAHVFGIGTSNKLFNIIREKHSLVYTIWCNLSLTDSCFYVVAFHDKNTKNKLFDLSLKLLDEMPNDVTDEELHSAKESIIFALKKEEDKISDLIMRPLLIEYLDAKDRKTIIEEVKKVKKDDFIKFYQTLALDTFYTLGAEDGN